MDNTALCLRKRDLRALLATFDQLYADFQDPNKDLDDLNDSLINLAPTLKGNGAKGPLINFMDTFATEVYKAKASAKAAGMYPSLDKIVNVILGGATITITQGNPNGYWLDPVCVGGLQQASGEVHRRVDPRRDNVRHLLRGLHLLARPAHHL